MIRQNEMSRQIEKKKKLNDNYYQDFPIFCLAIHSVEKPSKLIEFLVSVQEQPNGTI